jgi:hypothetical protein
MNAGSIPAELAQLSSLEILHLYDNNLTGKLHDQSATAEDDVNAGSIPAELSQLNCLQDLRLNNNDLSGKSYLRLHLISMT